jgi:hypothetical protein
VIRIVAGLLVVVDGLAERFVGCDCAGVVGAGAGLSSAVELQMTPIVGGSDKVVGSCRGVVVVCGGVYGDSDCGGFCR